MEAAVLEDTSHAPLPANAEAHTTLWPMNTLVINHAMTPTGIVAPLPPFTTSPMDVIHATLHTRVSLTPATPSTPHWNLSPEKPNSAQDPQPLITPTV